PRFGTQYCQRLEIITAADALIFSQAGKQLLAWIFFLTRPMLKQPASVIPRKALSWQKRGE
ncbi:hypothetical protein, partial [Escherichia coli]